jgi:hypothetical protein
MLHLHVAADSISMHYGPFLQDYVGDWYQYSRKGAPIAHGVAAEDPNGGDAPTLLDYLNRCRQQQAHWDVLLLNCGLHDIRSRSGECQTAQTIYDVTVRAIVKLASELARCIVWVRTTPVIDERHNRLKAEFQRFNHDIKRYNKIADAAILSERGWLIDLYGFTRRLGGEEIYQDHVHFGLDARRLQAAFIAGHLIALHDTIGTTGQTSPD